MKVRPVPDISKFLDSPVVKRALEMASKAHAGQVRKNNNEPYINHPVRIVGILVNEFGMKPSDDVIAAALLHDTVEDCGVSLADIASAINVNVANMVNTLSKPKVPDDAKPARDKAYFENIIYNGSAEVKAIKVADRLDNLRDMNGWPSKKKADYAKEAIDYVLPAAKGNDVAEALLEEQIEVVMTSLV
jgi:guanosine-3',5'-bis(diphosphate) 3'-pyrophosphohydrolase